MRKITGVNLVQPTRLSPGPCGLGPKKPTLKKLSSKKFIGPKTPHKPWGSRPTHGLSSSTEKYNIICGTDLTIRTGPTTRTSTTT